MTVVEKIKESAEALTAQERDELIEALVVAREEDQVAMIGQRIAEIDSGKVEGIPGDQVMAELRARLHDRA